MQVRFDALFPSIITPLFCDQNGNSPLHTLVQSNTTLGEFKAAVEELIAKDKLAFQEMLTTPNNDGKMPFLMITDKMSDIDEKLRILSDCFREKKVKPLSELINISELKSHYFGESERVIRNLEIGAEVVNLTRPFFKESSSHPDINCYSVPAQEELRVRTEKLIQSMTVLRDHGDTYFDESNKLAKEAQIGNCENYTMVALDILMKKFSLDVYARRYRIERGDHSFIVIDSKYIQESPNCWQKLPVRVARNKAFPLEACSESVSALWWSQDAVVCDPWAGAVFPICELPKKLMNRDYGYERDDRKTNWLGPVNPKFHFLEKAKALFVDDIAKAFYEKIHLKNIIN